jgi:hypothetical protein
LCNESKKESISIPFQRSRNMKKKITNNINLDEEIEDKLELEKEPSKKEEKDKLRYISKLESHLETTRENVKYSLDRLDILIISLSSAGLGLSVGFIKNLIPDITKVDMTYLKLSWMFYGLAIILNLISQITSYYANSNEIYTTINLIRAQRGKPLKGKQDNYEKLSSLFDRFTNYLNGLSLLSLILAIILMIVFITFSIKI